MNIYNREAPSLNKYENWSAEFRAFVDDCLFKDPNVRISTEDILVKHKKFFAKALDRTFIRENLLDGRKSFLERVPAKVKALGERHYSKLFKEQAEIGIGRSITPRPQRDKVIKWIFDDPETNDSSTDTFEKTIQMMGSRSV